MLAWPFIQAPSKGKWNLERDGQLGLADQIRCAAQQFVFRSFSHLLRKSTPSRREYQRWSCAASPNAMHCAGPHSLRNLFASYVFDGAGSM